VFKGFIGISREPLERALERMSRDGKMLSVHFGWALSSPHRLGKRIRETAGHDDFTS